MFKYKNIILFLSILLMNIFLPTIFNLFGVNMKYYINYVLVINVLMIFYFILPK
jgi:hypothetical protein